MLKSLRLYIRYFIKGILFRKERNYIFYDFVHFYLKCRYYKKIKAFTLEEKKEALGKAVSWLLRAQKMMKDDGFGSYRLTDGWSDSYPETSGYIIPTLIRYSKMIDDTEILNKAIAAGDWLIGIQKKSGGWQGGKMNENQQEVVFNSGQIIRGLLEIYLINDNDKYLGSSVKAGNWLCSVQHKEGYWKKYTPLNEARVYDSYVDVPLLKLWKMTGDKKYKDAAIKNLNWIVEKKQHKNGWFEDCDNTVKRNNKPILHTIAYTIDGLLNSGQILDDDKYIEAGKKAADILLSVFMEKHYLNGRYDHNWKGTEYLMTTGYAQMGVVWFKLYEITGNKKYFDNACKINDLLVIVQNRKIKKDKNTKGALTGSVPLWGRYELFGFPNWATKYFADSLMMEIKHS